MISQFQAIYASADISMPAPVATSLPALQCLPVQSLFTDIPLSFASKIILLGFFKHSLAGLSYAGPTSNLPVLLDQSFKSYPPGTLGIP